MKARGRQGNKIPAKYGSKDWNRTWMLRTALETRKISGMKYQSVYSTMKISSSTLYDWMYIDAGKMSIRYLGDLAQAANLSDAEIVKLVRGEILEKE